MDRPTTPTTVPAITEAVATTATQPLLSTSSSAVMKIVDLPDFEAEYDKVKQDLRFFEDAIAKKKELDDVTKSIEEHDKALKALLEEKSTVTCEHEAKKKEFELSITAFRERANKWRTQDLNPKDVLFNPHHEQSPSEAIPRVKSQVKLARENLALLEARLHLDEEFLLLQPVEKVLKELAIGIAGKERGIQELKEHECALVQEYNAAIGQWGAVYLGCNSKQRSGPEKYQHGQETKDYDPLPADSQQHKSILEEKIAEIAHLKSEDSSRQATIESLNETITELRKQLAEMKPIRDVGMNILQRKRENQKPKGEKNMEVVQRGNKAAHFGTALADAIRIICGPDDPVEKNWYSTNYGFSATFVLKYGSDAPIFLEVVEWHAAMKEFKSTAWQEDLTKFHTEFDNFKATLRLQHPEMLTSAKLETLLRENVQGKLHYEAMKTLYEAAYEIHKEERRMQLRLQN